MKIENFSAQAVIDGKPCFILIPEGKKDVVLDIIGAISEGGKLQAVKMPDTFRMMTLEDIKNEG